MATYENTGGHNDEDKKAANLFDNDVKTFWRGKIGTFGASVTVTFKEPVRFQYLDWRVPNTKNFDQDKFRGACLYGDGVRINCFSDDATFASGEKYQITGDLIATTYKFQLQREGAGAELKIGYKKAEIPGCYIF